MLYSCLFVVLIGLLQTQAQGPYFRGGAISWAVESFDQTKDSYNVSITYRMAWELGHGPCGKPCSSANISTPVTAKGPERFICEKGCKSQTALSDTSYTLTGVSLGQRWELGQRTFHTVFNSPGPLTVSVEGKEWVHLNTEITGDWRLQTVINPGVRSDTKRPNGSPVSFNAPVYQVIRGCLLPIKIQVMDPDRDIVRCRFPTDPKDCGGVCNSFPGVRLDESTCTITARTLLAYGYGLYAVAIVVEDFPDKDVTINSVVYNSTKPFSKTPVQFLVYANPSLVSCGKPGFNLNPWANGNEIVIKPGTRFNQTLCAEPGDQSLITNFIVSKPDDMKTHWMKGTGKGSLCIFLEWTPTVRDKGKYLLCVMAEQSNSLTSLPVCVTLHVDSKDECQSHPCASGLTCVDDGNSFRCVNRTGQHGEKIETPISCLGDVVDLVFMLDSSNSLAPLDQKEMKDFMTELVHKFLVDEGKARIGLVLFDNDVHLMFHLNKYHTKGDIVAAIQNITFGYGGTDTGKALKFLKDEMYTVGKGERPEIPNVLILLTDGQSKDAYATKYYARDIKNEGTTIFAIGIGPSIDIEELKNIGSSPTNKFVMTIDHYSNLYSVGKYLMNLTCEGRTLNQSTATPTTVTRRPGCYNANDKCFLYGEDVCTDYVGWSHDNCALWCGFCNGTTTPPPCEDVLTDCPEYGYDVCWRPEYHIWAMQNCRAYCGFPPCPNRTTTTSTTPPSTTPTICQDRVTTCNRYGGAAFCHDVKYVGWAKDNCADYCGYCTAYKTIPATTVGNKHCPAWKLPVECSMILESNCCPLPHCPSGYTLTVEKPHL